MNIVLVLSLLVAGCSTILARNWPVKDGRPCACNRLHDPVCGSDGQDYPNADCARNCGKVRSFIRGYCDKPALCGCPYNIATVCARRPDGTLDDFDNRCIAECQNGASFLSDGPCPAKPVQPLPDLFAAQLRELRSMGEERVKKDDQVCACPTIYSPVCGLKNRIWRDYASPCLANCAGVESSKPGTCKPKPKPCACGRNYSPVCARKADGTLSDYSNGCVAGCEGAVIVNSGRCQAKPDNSLPHHDKKGLGCACTRIYAPVCAEKDGIKKVYSNKCVARCQGAIYVDDGNCDGPALLRGFRDDRSPAQLPVFPEDLRPAQLPVFPEDLRPAQLPVFPEDLRPAQLPVFPEDLRPAQLPVFPDDTDDSDLVANQLPWFNDDSNDSDDSDDSDLVAAHLPNFPSLFKRRAQH